MARDLSRHREDAVRITTAASSRNDEINARQRRYLFSMSLRTICFVGAVLASGWLQWVLIAGALVLPYIAVVLANATSSRSDDFQLRTGGFERPELTGAAGHTEPRPL